MYVIYVCLLISKMYFEPFSCKGNGFFGWKAAETVGYWSEI